MMAKTHTIDGVQFREVTRSPKVGDFILYNETPRDYLTAGKPYEVTEIDFADDPQIIDDEGDGYDTYGDDYVVLEKVEVAYHEVKRAAKVGEKIKIVAPFISGGRYGNGDVFEVRSYHPATLVGSAYVYVKEHDVKILDHEYVVLEPVTSADIIVHDVLEPVAPQLAQLETELAATKAKVAEMEAQLAAVKKAEAEAQRLKVGDYAKVVQSGHGNYGKIVEITKDDLRGPYVYATKHLNEDGADIHAPGQLVRATDEEVAEAKRKLELHEIESKWHAIGREIGEFKEGDFAQVVDSPCALPDGSFFEVKHVRGGNVYDHEGFVYMLPHKQLKLVAPVESVVNLGGGDAA